MSKKNEKKQEVTAVSAFDCLAVTQVRVYPFQGGENLGKMRGLAQIVLNDQFVVRGLRIMDGAEGLFVSYPCDPFYKGEDYKSLCNPITRQLREHIEACVLEKYKANLEPVDWKVHFSVDGCGLEMTVNETDRDSAINTARELLRAKFGAVVDKAEADFADKV